jgi:hypothetical protein
LLCPLAARRKKKLRHRQLRPPLPPLHPLHRHRLRCLLLRLRQHRRPPRRPRLPRQLLQRRSNRSRVRPVSRGPQSNLWAFLVSFPGIVLTILRVDVIRFVGKSDRAKKRRDSVLSGRPGHAVAATVSPLCLESLLAHAGHHYKKCAVRSNVNQKKSEVISSMKKLISLALCLGLALALSAGCKKKEEAPAEAPKATEQAAPAAPAQAPMSSAKAAPGSTTTTTTTTTPAAPAEKK